MKLSCSGSRDISSADVCGCLQIAVANNLGVAGRRHAQISVAAIPAFRVLPHALFLRQLQKLTVASRLIARTDYYLALSELICGSSTVSCFKMLATLTSNCHS